MAKETARIHTTKMSRRGIVSIVGPESTGKTTLSRHLGTHFKACIVPEVARTYLPKLGRPYTEADLLTIARLQQAAILEQVDSGAEWVICDTNISVIRIWSEYTYGRVHPEIIQLEKSTPQGLFLLTDTDLPWEADPLREHPDERNAIFSAYYNLMLKRGVPFRLVFGQGEERISRAIRHCVEFYP
jgi:nicotinamide riboside kinase